MASQRFNTDTVAHEIVDAAGARVEWFTNKSSASRKLNSWRRTFETDHGTQARLDYRNPSTFTIRPVRKGA